MNAKLRGFRDAKSGYVNPDIPLISLAAPVRHALQALVHLSASSGAAAETSRVARKLRLPAAALSKSFQRLAKSGLLASRRGPGGGYRLAIDPGDITLADVARALDLDDARRGRCVLEDRPCSGDAACALHRAAMDADATLRAELARLTVADLAGRARTAQRRSSPLRQKDGNIV